MLDVYKSKLCDCNSSIVVPVLAVVAQLYIALEYSFIQGQFE